MNIIIAAAAAANAATAAANAIIINNNSNNNNNKVEDPEVPREMVDMQENKNVFDLDRQFRERMTKLWLEQKYCDFSIITNCGNNNEKQKLSAHKLVLASCSEYFERMFDHENVTESVTSELTISDISHEVMNRILHFCYTKKLALDGEIVKDILVAAHRMQIFPIQNLCIEFIDKAMDITNCIGVLSTANHLNLTELHERSLKFCLENFESIIREKQYLEADEATLIEILSNDDLIISEEEILVQTILDWLNHNAEERISKVEALMSHVRFATFKLVDLVNLSSKFELFRTSIKCRDLLDDAKNFRLLKGSKYRTISPWFDQFTPKYEERLAVRRHQRIYVVGGWSNYREPIKSSEKFNPYKNDWTTIRPMERARCGVGVAILGKNLYAIGGHDGEKYLRSVERMSIEDETWHSDVSDLINERSSLGVAILDGFIYAIGGQSGPHISESVERYDLNENQWQRCISMKEKRLGAGVTVLNGLIYVIGGSDYYVTNTVEFFEPKSMTWTYGVPMNNARKHLGCTTFEGKIYVVGGRNETELDTGECFDPTTNTWTDIAPMSKPRSGLSLVELDGLLYAIGGITGDTKLSMVEAYDPRRDCWQVKESMSNERLGAGAVVYSQLKP